MDKLYQMRLDWTHALKPATPQKVVRPKEDPAELAKLYNQISQEISKLDSKLAAPMPANADLYLNRLAIVH